MLNSLKHGALKLEHSPRCTSEATLEVRFISWLHAIRVFARKCVSRDLGEECFVGARHKNSYCEIEDFVALSFCPVVRIGLIERRIVVQGM